MLAQVLTSWQVLVVTIVLIIYIFLVTRAAKIRGRSGRTVLPKLRKRKMPKSRIPSSPELVSGNDELGLEEAPKN